MVVLALIFEPCYEQCETLLIMGKLSSESSKGAKPEAVIPEFRATRFNTRRHQKETEFIQLPHSN